MEGWEKENKISIPPSAPACCKYWSLANWGEAKACLKHLLQEIHFLSFSVSDKRKDSWPLLEQGERLVLIFWVL